MRFTYNGKTYRIWFSHHNKPHAIRYTECSIMLETADGLEEQVNSDAFCSDGDAKRGLKPDNYCKAVGRKYALARALKTLTKDRAFRHTAWMAYLNRGAEPAEQHKLQQLVITGEGQVQ